MIYIMFLAGIFVGFMLSRNIDRYLKTRNAIKDKSAYYDKARKIIIEGERNE